MCARSKAAAKSSNSSQSSGSIGRRIFQRIAIGWLTRIRKWLSIDFLFVHFVVEGRFLCQTVTQISYEAFCSCPQTFCDETTKIVQIVCPLQLNPVAHFYFLKQVNIQNGTYELKKRIFELPFPKAPKNISYFTTLCELHYFGTDAFGIIFQISDPNWMESSRSICPYQATQFQMWRTRMRQGLSLWKWFSSSQT